MNLQTMPLRFRVWDRVKEDFLYHGYTGSVDITFSILCLPIEIDILDDNQTRYIISQDTGLKDKNGESIYIGDIVRLPSWADKGYEIVRYSLPCRGIIPCVKGCPDCCNPCPHELEVIGNIWQNPELLCDITTF